ncbi:NosD domain-containing protein [Halococcus saccharolyticus]|uniref:Periplasmic copper-binding protein NosD beta helix domain-containing protein n=1 Tax=Halococcus saccharolyticus DSM 5350 TaxID=1227455 RepID=M0MII7_9EURY|nr:NosD domain-containing protein [Halococcus saccharolyticus]EMA45502.1 hypothetical protein C449_07775 [Halococcus saccharolyticus DSM 5350]
MRRRPGFDSNGAENRRTLLVGVVVVALLVGATGSLVGLAGAQSGGNATGVDSCRTIDASGTYVLTENVTGGDGNCLTITASNVTLDGAGHSLQGSGSGHAIHANGSSRAVENVTIRRVQTSNWTVGVFYLGVDGSTIRGTVADNNTQGITLANANDNRIVDNTAYVNGLGIAVGGESENNTLRNNVAVDNKWGIHFERESENNTVTDNTARNNTRWDYYSLRNDGTNTVTDLRLSTTTVSLTEQNVGLRSSTSPPEIPQGTRSLGTFVEVTSTGGGGSELSMTMSYEGSNASSVTVWRNDGEYWTEVNGAETDTAANTATATNLTQFGTFAPLADVAGAAGGSVNVSADAAPPIQQTLTPVASPPTVANGTTTTANDTTASNATANASANNVTASSATNATASNATANGTTASNATANTSMNGATPATTTDAPATITPAENVSGNGSTTAAPETGESGATSGFGFGLVRIVFVLLGAVALATLGVVAVRQSR